MKYWLGTITLTLFLKTAVAQKRDTAVYFVKNSGMLTANKDSADYFLLVLPPDTSLNKDLFVVKGYYPNGKIKLITSSLNDRVPLKFQGGYIGFFSNGHRMVIENFENGQVSGAVTAYYPNGRFHYEKSFSTNARNQTEVSYKTCNDSTGNVIAENGNGDWLEYNDDFTAVTTKGKIADGVEDGDWDVALKQFSGEIRTYNKGKITGVQPCYIENGKFYLSVETVPEFPGGLDAFGKFLAANIRYPYSARRDRVQGRVIVSFVIEKDGTITDPKVARGIGGGCDEEALRVIKLMPKWVPGIQNGKPVRVAYSVPIAFTIN